MHPRIFAKQWVSPQGKSNRNYTTEVGRVRVQQMLVTNSFFFKNNQTDRKRVVCAYGGYTRRLSIAN